MQLDYLICDGVQLTEIYIVSSVESKCSESITVVYTFSGSVINHKC